MYTVIRKYDLMPGTKEQLIRDAQEHLVPILIRVPGLKEYSLVEVGDHEVVISSTFNTFADAKASAQLIRDWLDEHSQFFQEVSTIVAGEVRIPSESVCLPQTGEEELLRGVF